MGHSLLNNLRQGNWLMDYMLDRLIPHPEYKSLVKWLAHYFDAVSLLNLSH